ncbi:protein lin-9 homolog [Anthonomus grandis grandis]|uniref:protein lin-9 homolog n=1 Tax=Anthonomus grandis grandis TaxID=2921223 RepID=UPI002165EA18|nr:protein lin-9 homolog [Anthonomus grandis grandis]XP_050299714.1 protein lin-9 homolog [Anthonomus grandis grandis]
MTNNLKIKEELMEDDDMEQIEGESDEMQVDDPNTLGPAALGLRRVGAAPPPKPSPTQPTQVLNARGMPARIRKKNKLFFDDDIVNTPHHRVSSGKKQKPTPTKRTPKTNNTLDSHTSANKTPTNKKTFSRNSAPATPVTPARVNSPDRRIGQKIGMRLRNLLKLPKAHKWVCYEWFYSNIDKCLFSGENDFQICLKESFPELKTRELTRTEWTKIRRMMGKPRRCSQAFFDEERLELEKKRKKVRALQQRKMTDLANFKDLPGEIPMQLVIGTKVTARLRKPSDGLYTGSIDAVDPSNNTYRITFERQGLGTHSVPDFEVLSHEEPETISLASFQNKFRPRNNGLFSLMTPDKSPMTGCKTLPYRKDPLLSGIMPNSPVPFSALAQGRVGQFPLKYLEKVVLVMKILNAKKTRIKQLKAMNSEAEKLNSFEEELTEDFERKYANILIDLEKLNMELQTLLDELQVFCQEISPDPHLTAILTPSLLRERCKEEAKEIVQKHSSVNYEDNGTSRHPGVLDLITDLTALLLQIKNLADSDHSPYELQVLEGTVQNIKRKLSPQNQQVFQRSVEVHMKQIENGLMNINLDKLVIGPIAKV